MPEWCSKSSRAKFPRPSSSSSRASVTRCWGQIVCVPPASPTRRSKRGQIRPLRPTQELHVSLKLLPSSKASRSLSFSKRRINESFFELFVWWKLWSKYFAHSTRFNFFGRGLSFFSFVRFSTWNCCTNVWFQKICGNIMKQLMRTRSFWNYNLLTKLLLAVVAQTHRILVLLLLSNYIWFLLCDINFKFSIQTSININYLSRQSSSFQKLFHFINGKTIRYFGLFIR